MKSWLWAVATVVAAAPAAANRKPKDGLLREYASVPRTLTQLHVLVASPKAGGTKKPLAFI